MAYVHVLVSRHTERAQLIVSNTHDAAQELAKNPGRYSLCVVYGFDCAAHQLVTRFRSAAPAKRHAAPARQLVAKIETVLGKGRFAHVQLMF